MAAQLVGAAALAAAKLVAKKLAVDTAKKTGAKGSVKKVKKSINNPKMQTRFENLTKGSNTLSPSSMARTNRTKPVPVKKKGK
jgi:hypothetical protein